ncbi:hypothetical protein LPJ59_005847 [Coemansia sp. RSA 2399]|nr:hypothetical protein LPJ59_005847 [Coemansia sp. RSA 2399]
MRSDNAIVDQKRSYLNTIENFRDRIVNGFGYHDSNTGDSEILKGLATNLHMALFFNPDLDTEGTEDAETPSEPVDPFEMRVEKEKDMTEDLLNIFEYYVDLACK